MGIIGIQWTNMYWKIKLIFTSPFYLVILREGKKGYFSFCFVGFISCLKGQKLRYEVTMFIWSYWNECRNIEIRPMRNIAPALLIVMNKNNRQLIRFVSFRLSWMYNYLSLAINWDQYHFSGHIATCNFMWIRCALFSGRRYHSFNHWLYWS